MVFPSMYEPFSMNVQYMVFSSMYEPFSLYVQYMGFSCMYEPFSCMFNIWGSLVCMSLQMSSNVRIFKCIVGKLGKMVFMTFYLINNNKVMSSSDLDLHSYKKKVMSTVQL